MGGKSTRARSTYPTRKLLYLYNVCGLGGVETSIVNKTAALKPFGIEVSALFQSYWGQGGRILAQQPGFTVEADEEARIRHIRNSSPSVIIVVDLPRAIKLVDLAGVCCPVLFESHAPDPQALERRVLPGALHPRVSTVIVPSQFNRKVLVEHGVDPEHVRVIPNAIDFTRVRPIPSAAILKRIGVPRDKQLVLFVGRLEPQKNPIEFIRIAVDLLSRVQTIHFVVLGDAVDTAELAATVQQEAAALNGNITFVERLSYEHMPALYSAVATSRGCLLSTSLYESQPMIVLEAMACGCPVVATDVGGLREMVEDGITGHLYAVGDITCAVAFVSKILSDQDHRSSVIRSAMSFVQSKHTLEKAGEAYLALLDEIVPAV